MKMCTVTRALQGRYRIGGCNSGMTDREVRSARYHSFDFAVEAIANTVAYCVPMTL